MGPLSVSNGLTEFAALAAKKIKSFSPGACTSGKILLSLSVWNLPVNDGQIMRMSGCKNCPKALKGFSGSLREPRWGLPFIGLFKRCGAVPSRVCAAVLGSGL